MKLTIISTKGTLEIRDLDQDSVLDMVEEMEHESVWHFTLDEGKSETYVFRNQVVRVDIEA